MFNELKRSNGYGKIFVRKKLVYEEPFAVYKSRDDIYNPPAVESLNYINWIATLELKPCVDCREMHGKIYRVSDVIDTFPPLHPNCRCEIKNMEAVHAGDATKDGEKGADYWLKYFGTLPEYYVTEEAARNAGWRFGKSPIKYVPGKMITMGIYDNEDGHLPQKEGRIWYEADINYYKGKRNGHRVVWSNDGLIFVTYDHYHTFYEVI